MQFNFIATGIFFLAILHTFLTPYLFSLSRKFSKKSKRATKNWRHYHFVSEICYLLSEIEVVFGIWLLPLLLFATWFLGWDEVISYLHGRDYTYAFYIMVIVVVMTSGPIIAFAEKILDKVALLGKESPGAWWWTILTIGPLLGAFLKEPGAMALCAALLLKKFYSFKPSTPFKYATLGLLFTNISVGGTLTTFASRALFIVASKRGWDTTYMLTHFAWKACLGILLANATYYFIFKKEFKETFPKKLRSTIKKDIPFWITFLHLLFVTAIVLTANHVSLFIAVFILFLGFYKATTFYQSPLHLRSAVLVGFFFASLLIHGELQGWWVVPLLQQLPQVGAMFMSFVLSAFMDNAVVNYLSLEVPHFNEMKHYLMVSGAMSAGALTIVANAPNPLGHAILRSAFSDKISLFYLFLGALFPSCLLLFIFWVFR